MLEIISESGWGKCNSSTTGGQLSILEKLEKNSSRINHTIISFNLNGETKHVFGEMKIGLMMMTSMPLSSHLEVTGSNRDNCEPPLV